MYKISNKILSTCKITSQFGSKRYTMPTFFKFSNEFQFYYWKFSPGRKPNTSQIIMERVTRIFIYIPIACHNFHSSKCFLLFRALSHKLVLLKFNMKENLKLWSCISAITRITRWLIRDSIKNSPQAKMRGKFSRVNSPVS